jgi:methionyl-tRNA formyltransferase
MGGHFKRARDIAAKLEEEHKLKNAEHFNKKAIADKAREEKEEANKPVDVVIKPVKKNKAKVKIEDTDNCGTMFEKLSIAARDLLMETIPLLIEGKTNPIKQNESEATFAYNITNEEKVLNFNLPARSVFNHIRAYNPAPIAYFELKGDQIKVFDSIVVDETTTEAPGTILLHRKNRLMIACGEGTVIELLTVQPTGKKVMQARDFINGGLRKYL